MGRKCRLSRSSLVEAPFGKRTRSHQSRIMRLTGIDLLATAAFPAVHDSVWRYHSTQDQPDYGSSV